MDVSFIWRENRGGFEPRALRNVPGARFNPRRPARRQANPPYLLPIMYNKLRKLKTA